MIRGGPGPHKALPCEARKARKEEKSCSMVISMAEISEDVAMALAMAGVTALCKSKCLQSTNEEHKGNGRKMYPLRGGFSSEDAFLCSSVSIKSMCNLTAHTCTIPEFRGKHLLNVSHIL